MAKRNEGNEEGQETSAEVDQGAKPRDFSSPREVETSDSHQYTLAELQYTRGLRILFSYDATLDDYSMLQRGQADDTNRIVLSGFGTPLEAYLSITPENLPIPEELLAESPMRKALMAQIEARGIASACVLAKDLDLSIPPSTMRSANQSCLSTYYPWSHWHDGAAPGLAPASYYSSTFGGRCRWIESYIFNCTPKDSGSWLWARHRFYYKNAWGNYKNNYESKVPPGTYEGVSKWGLAKRYRQVHYDDGWDASPNNAKLKYTREGRFLDL